MSVVVEHGGELYSLLVDSVGEVLSLAGSDGRAQSGRRSIRVWRELSAGIYRLDGKLLVVLDVAACSISPLAPPRLRVRRSSRAPG